MTVRFSRQIHFARKRLCELRPCRAVHALLIRDSMSALFIAYIPNP
jgi:hypothetical protein